MLLSTRTNLFNWDTDHGPLLLPFPLKIFKTMHLTAVPKLNF